MNNNSHYYTKLEDIFKSLEDVGYKDRKFLNKGGMGEVSLATDTACQRKVVIKTLHEKYKNDNLAILRFIGEAQITSQLEHPNIIPVYDTGINDEGLPFYIMKYVEGMNLSDVVQGIKKNKPEFIKRFTLNEILEIVAKISDAMNSSVTKGVLHRDLKPDNIMVGDYGEITIVDWGLAKIINQDSKIANDIDEVIRDLKIESINTEKNINLTMENTLQGTPSYMSPERIIGEETEQGEVYAIGSIFYYLLTLEHAYPLENNITDLVKKVYEGKYKRPEEFTNLPHMPGGLIPPPLCAVLNKALARDTECRYQKVLDIRSEIDAYRTGHATIAEDADFLKKVFLVLKRNKRLSLLLLTLSILSLVTVSLTIIDLKRQERKAAKASQLAKSTEITAEERKIDALKKQQELKDKIEELNEKSSVLLENAKSYIKTMKFGKAKSLLLSAIELQDSPKFHETLGFLQLSEKDYENAIRSFKRVSQWKPNSLTEEIDLCRQLKSQALNESALIEYFQKHKKHEFAIRLLNRAKTINITKLKEEWLKKIAGTAVSAYLNLKKSNFEVLSNGGIRLRLENSKNLKDISPLTGMPLVTLTLINCPALSLEPIKECYTLKNLIISGVLINDTTPLKGLSLNSVHINNTKIKDLSFLLQNSRPILLNLANIDISSLAGLDVSRLTQLDISGTLITDLSPLSKSPLEKLVAKNSQCSDLTPLEACPLKQIDLTGSTITDINFLKNIELETLNISHTPIRSLKGVNVNRLKALDISNTQIKSLHPISKAKSLTTLIISNSAVTSLADLNNSSLTQFSARGTVIKDFSPIFVQSLLVLDIEGSFATSLENIHVSKNLQTLNLKGTDILNIQPLKKCLKLKYLNISDTLISDLTPLQGKALVSFEASNTSDLVLLPLASCKKLVQVILKNSLISDISPLMSLPLQTIDLERCLNINDVSPLTKVKTLKHVILPYHLPIEQFEGFRSMNLSFIHWTNQGTKRSFWGTIDNIK